MKSGFHSDLQLDTKELQRDDQNIPLDRLAGLKENWRVIQKKLELPEQYLRTCTLKEGTIVTMVIYQTMSLGVVIFLSVMILILPKKTDDWWKEKFRNDLDFYYQDENQDLQKQLHDLWLPLTYAVIGVHFLFFLCGWLVIYALLKKDVHPCWYMPWIIVSCTLSAVHWLICGCMVISVFIFAFYREISVTWDLVPIACSVGYGVGWTYSCAVVIAHYRRRTIVRYWKSRQHLLGMDNTYPPEITEYLYQFGNKSR